MDQTIVDSIRKTLETKSTEELRQAFEGGDKAVKSPEEVEAIRQLLDDRRMNGNRLVLALASATLVGSLGAGCAWWQGFPDLIVILSGAIGAILGIASWYIPNLIPNVRI